LTEYIGGRREHPVAPEALTQANDPDPEEDEPEQYSEKVQTEPEAAPIKQTADDDEPYIP
jgi:hypothetical protein